MIIYSKQLFGCKLNWKSFTLLKMDSVNLISDWVFPKLMFIMPPCTLASVSHNTLTMSQLQDIEVTVGERDCGMCGENKAAHSKEKAPEPADRCHSGRMDRVGPQ